jgi:integrase
MAYRRTGSPHYQIRRRKLIGYGDTGQITSRTKNKKVAERMEQALEDLAEKALIEPRYRGILEAVCRDHTISPGELLAARNRLDSILVAVTDPKLTEAVAAFERGATWSHVTRAGIGQLLMYAPAGARLSFLTAKTITTLCHTAMEAPEREGTRHRNTVNRCLKRTISKLLRFSLGNARRNAIFADVEFSPVDDTREVHLDPAEIGSLLSACHDLGYSELSVVIRMALMTSADRAVLLAGDAHHGKVCRGLLVRDVKVLEDAEGRWGEIYLWDTKTRSRTRTVAISANLATDLLHLALGKDLDEPVFSIAYRELDYLWKATRRKAGLNHVRFKDLRAQMSQYAELAGVPLTVVTRGMGQSNVGMTRRYQQRRAVFGRGHAAAVEDQMGLASLQQSLQAGPQSHATAP